MFEFMTDYGHSIHLIAHMMYFQRIEGVTMPAFVSVPDTYFPCNLLPIWIPCQGERIRRLASLLCRSLLISFLLRQNQHIPMHRSDHLHYLARRRCHPESCHVRCQIIIVRFSTAGKSSPNSSIMAVRFLSSCAHRKICRKMKSFQP